MSNGRFEISAWKCGRERLVVVLGLAPLAIAAGAASRTWDGTARRFRSRDTARRAPFSLRSQEGARSSAWLTASTSSCSFPGALHDHALPELGQSRLAGPVVISASLTTITGTWRRSGLVAHLVQAGRSHPCPASEGPGPRHPAHAPSCASSPLRRPVPEPVLQPGWLSRSFSMSLRESRHHRR